MSLPLLTGIIDIEYFVYNGILDINMSIEMHVHYQTHKIIYENTYTINKNTSKVSKLLFSG